MSTSEEGANGLYRVAAIGGIAVATFLVAGASGHFAAIWDKLDGSDGARLALLAPGIVLLASGVANFAVCAAIWRARQWAQRVALVVNLFAAAYFAYLLSRGVPNHPIGLFLAVVGGHTIVLGSISAGLRWPNVARPRDAVRRL